MSVNWRATIILTAVAVAVLGTVFGLTLSRASGDDEGARYEVTVRFNTSVTQGDIDEAGALLRSYDEDVEFLIMESFPPIGRAVLATDAPETFCGTIETELEAKSYVDDVSCGPWEDKDIGEPDAPVTNQN